jgi:hypothetical protein
MNRLLNHPRVKPLLSDEHFSVDGTLIEAWASQKSFRPKDGSDFHRQKRKNDTPRSTTDPDSRLYRKAAGREATLRPNSRGEITDARGEKLAEGFLEKGRSSSNKGHVCPFSMWQYGRRHLRRSAGQTTRSSHRRAKPNSGRRRVVDGSALQESRTPAIRC